MTGATRWSALVVCATAVLASGSAFAADGEALYNTKTCVACHGPGGNAPITPAYPKLAGQNRAYLATQVRDIRDGRRTNGQSAVMKSVVAGLTDAEIDAIASYLAGVK